MQQQYLKNIKYLNFLLSQVSISLSNNRNNGYDFTSAEKLITRLQTSDDITKDIFVILNVSQLSTLARYLIFVLKKLETGTINFDNLTRNLNEDRRFIETELKNIFSGSTENTTKPAQSEEKIKQENLTLDLKFKVEEIEREMITEEFKESTEPMNEAGFAHNYLDIRERAEIPGDYYAEQQEEPTESTKEESITSESVILTTETVSPTVEKLSDAEEDLNIKKSPREIYRGKAKIEQNPEKVTTEQPDFTLNKRIIAFETQLLNKNAQLRKDLSGLSDKVVLESVNDKLSSETIERIVKSGSEMRDEADKLSFTLIAEIYSIIVGYLSDRANSRERIKVNEIETLKTGLGTIESLVSGDDFLKHEELLKELESLKGVSEQEVKHVEEKVTAQSKSKIPDQPAPTKEIESAKQILSPGSIKLQRNIIELETLFSKLDDIEGEYQNYEGLRFLSSSFVILKEMIQISKELNLPKLAQLSEASYIFIKFLQNYRMNPFDKAIKEVYTYIVYNFKLIYLDKPTKDLDTFISYLNDPVKIFTKKSKRKKDNE